MIWLAAQIVKVFDSAGSGVAMTDEEAQKQARKWHAAFNLAKKGGYSIDLANELYEQLSK